MSCRLLAEGTVSVLPERLKLSRHQAIFADRVELTESGHVVWLMLTSEAIAQTSSWLFLIRRWKVECRALPLAKVVRVSCEWDPFALERARFTVEWRDEERGKLALRFETSLPRLWAKGFRRVGIPVEGWPNYRGLRRLALYLDLLLLSAYTVGALFTFALALALCMKWQPARDPWNLVALFLTAYGWLFVVAVWFLLQRPNRRGANRARRNADLPSIKQKTTDGWGSFD